MAGSFAVGSLIESGTAHTVSASLFFFHRGISASASRIPGMKPTARIALITLCVVLLTIVSSHRVIARQANGAAVPRTMRVDYFHTGNDKQEWFSLDRVVME